MESTQQLPSQEAAQQTPPSPEPLPQQEPSAAELPQQPPEQSSTAQPQAEPAPQPTPDTNSYNQYSEQSSFIPGINKPMKEEVLLEWTAPSRPFKKHNRQFYTTIGAIAGLIALILFFAGQVLPVAVVVAVVFLTYVMNSIEPGDVVHKLTTYGIRVEDELYYWEELGRFWIKEKFDQPVLYIEVGRFPNRLTILLGKISKEDMQLILSEVLLNEEPPPTSYEKAAKWLHQKIPIDLEA